MEVDCVAYTHSNRDVPILPLELILVILRWPCCLTLLRLALHPQRILDLDRPGDMPAMSLGRFMAVCSTLLRLARQLQQYP